MASQVSKWGDSLAIRLPAEVVNALQLKEGDQVEIRPAGERSIEIEVEYTREDALKRLRETRWPLPDGYKFDRLEANER